MLCSAATASFWKAINSRDFNKNASFRSYGTFAYLLRAHIRNTNMRRYITSARGHELKWASSRTRIIIIIIMPGLNARWLQSKFLITPLSE